jgi:MFS transporter, putative metabolite:H+ symporter
MGRFRNVISVTVLVASLGYFVDMFDLTIFGVVRIESLKAIGINGANEITNSGILLINLQALGMLLGGLLWGVISDKRGRLSVLFASIFIYSVANFLNAFITDIHQYALLRFIAGVGLAGELGAAVTLVSEMLKKEDRGYGTTMIAALGLLGAVAASLIGQYFSWKTAYLLGGGLGFLLLFTRFRMSDSQMFKRLEKSSTRGDLKLLFNAKSFSKYIFCILLGIPIYFVTGILLTFSPELTASMGIKGITAGNALLAGTIGLTMGDLLYGILSQWLKSRRLAIFVALGSGFIFTLLYFLPGQNSSSWFYVICFALGMSSGYWAVLITVAAEQFGTNIRGTVATSVPNFVRSAVIPLSLFFTAVKSHWGVFPTSLFLAFLVFGLALFSLKKLKETFGKDLDYSETLAVAVVQKKTSQGDWIKALPMILILILIPRLATAQDVETSTSTAAPTAALSSSNWKALVNSYYFNMDGTHPATNNLYSFGHVDVSLENFTAEYALNSQWKITGNFSDIQNSYELLAKGNTYIEQSSGIGDTLFEANYSQSNLNSSFSVDAGVSFPTGNINVANPYVANAHYKYFMQLGSGTYDGVLGATEIYQGKMFSAGGRLSSIFRSSVFNSNGYHLGNQYRADLWADTPLPGGFKAKLYAYDRDRGAITGIDPTLSRAATLYYYSDQIDWMAAAAITYRHQFFQDLGLSAEIGVPLLVGMINVDNVVISTRYYANLGISGRF